MSHETPNRPLVTIGIVPWNAGEYIAACLRTVFAQTYPNLEVILIDNASSDGSPDQIEKDFPDVQMIRLMRNVGFGSAHNIGIAESRGEYYCPLNPDVELDSRFIEEMVDALEARPDFGYATGHIYQAEDEDPRSDKVYTTGHLLVRSGVAYSRYAYHHVRAEDCEPGEVGGASGVCPLYRRQMLDDVMMREDEYFDSAYFMYTEDVDLDWRAHLAGWRCWYTPAARAWHAPESSGGSGRTDVYGQITANRFLMLIKDMDLALLPRMLPYILKYDLTHSLGRLRRRPGAIKPFLFGLVRGICGALRKRKMVRRNRVWSPGDMWRWLEENRRELERIRKSAPGGVPNGIVCLSHLKWEETLFQRPQQIMRRMAQKRPVLYISYIGTKDFLRSVLRLDRRAVFGKSGENLTYMNIPCMPMTRRFPVLGEWRRRFSLIVARRMMRKRGMQNAALWLYDSSYAQHTDRIPHSVLVYDCMDLFQAFQSADPKHLTDEKMLLERADTVFTGGRSLQRAKEGVNPRTFCFPSGVDYEHFAKAVEAETSVPDDISGIAGPILGYFGAIDERIDFDLVRALCEARGDWSVVFLGPIIEGGRGRVDRPNFHHLGPKPYEQLPGYLKAFDVCLMPFVRSELTEHISPTKTPEYLAGGKPVVSTPVPDVVVDYGEVVHVCETSEAFIAACEAALAEKRPGLAACLRDIAAAQSWENIVERMEAIAFEGDNHDA